MCADSFMTSPSWPVRVSPVPPVSASASEASMKRTSPPAPVTARPVATPGTAVRRSAGSWAASGTWCGRPIRARSCSAPIAAGSSRSPSSVCAATLRSTRAIARSRFRTPASRVYSPASFRSAGSSTATSSSLRPARSSWRGSRWSRAMTTFSSSV